MAKLYTGTYGAGTTAENALNTALMQYPEIARTLVKQYPRYAATYLLERTGRYAQEKVLGDNSFEWKVMGRYNAPTYMLGWISTDAVSWAAENGASGTGAAGVVTYAPVSAAFSSVTIYYMLDGVRHKVTGCRGNASISAEVGAIPSIDFAFTGVYHAPDDSALPD